MPFLLEQYAWLTACALAGAVPSSLILYHAAGTLWQVQPASLLESCGTRSHRQWCWDNAVIKSRLKHLTCLPLLTAMPCDNFIHKIQDRKEMRVRTSWC